MSLFDKFKKRAVFNRKTDEAIYSAVAQEMENGIKNNGLWLKALEQAQGNSEKQVAEYIRLRVQSLKDDIGIISDEINSTSNIKNNRDIEELITMINDNATFNKIESYLSGMDSQTLSNFINTPDACDEYPIHVSIKRKRIDIARWFLEAGANTKVKNYWGETPLKMAERVGDEEIIFLIGKHST